MVLDDYRCGCGRLLFKGALLPGSKVEVKCKKCGVVTVVDKAGEDYENYSKEVES